MGKFAATLKDSIEIFSANPVLIVPKLTVAALYSALILATTSLFTGPLEPSVAMLVDLLLLLFSSIVVSLLDTFMSSMYPIMVRQVWAGEKVSLSSALKGAAAKAPQTIPPVIIIELCFLAIIALFWLVSSFIVPLGSAMDGGAADPYQLAFSVFYLALAVAVVFLFYLIFPVAVYENVSVLEALRRSVSLSLCRKAEVAKATILSFAVSGLSFALAFLINLFPGEEGTMFFWSAFIIVRFLTAYIYTYLYILNPVFYLNYIEAAEGVIGLQPSANAIPPPGPAPREKASGLRHMWISRQRKRK